MPKRAAATVRSYNKYRTFHNYLLLQRLHYRILEPAGGIEHSICCLRRNYSSIELRRQILSLHFLVRTAPSQAFDRKAHSIHRFCEACRSL